MREQEKAKVKRRIFSEEEREKEIQRAPANGQKRGQQQREANYKGSEREEEVSRVLAEFSLTLRPRKIQTFFTNCRLILASGHNSNHVSVKH